MPIQKERSILRSTALLAVLSSFACGDKTIVDPTVPVASVTDVAVADAGSPIFRRLSVGLDGPSAVVVEYWTENAPRLRINSEVNRSTHELFVPRLRAASVYNFEITPVSTSGDSGDVFQASFETGTLPKEIAELQFQVIGTATFPLLMLETFPKTIMIDTDGYVVWYRPDSAGSHGFTRLANGDFVFNMRESIEVVTPTNEVVATLTEADAAVRSGQDSFNIHHDVVVTPQNSVIFLVRGETVTVSDTAWVGDAIWEWDPANDALTKRWTATDFLSPVTDRGARSRPSDWLHANSLSIGPRGNLLVSLFWIHEVLSIAADYQSIEWRLGGPASTFVVTDNAMEAGQHTAEEVVANRILLFDNGRDRPSGELFSRALEIEVDQAAGTALIVWEFRPQPDIYAPIISSTRRLSNGNTVVGFGMSSGWDTPPSTGPVTVFEVTPQNRILWRLVVEGTRFVYRMTPLKNIAGEEQVYGF